MHVQETDYMLNFTYEKTAAEIVDKSKTKSKALRAKVEERRERIKHIRAEYGIDDAVLIDLLQQARANARNAVMQYTSNAKAGGGAKGLTEDAVIVPAGVVNNLMTEQDFITGELEQAAKLDVIIRNLVDFPDERRGQEGKMRGHRLTQDELVYLGF